MLFQRIEYQKVLRRMNEPRRFIQVVTGPRQVGKTTLVNQVLRALPFPGHYASADGFITMGSVWIKEQFDIARSMQKQNPSVSFLLILDEIQKIENWSEAVKHEWDTDTLKNIPLLVILSGSSRLLLQKGLSESLAGRFELISMSHWSYNDMHAAFGLDPDQFVWYGGYPGSVPIMDQEERWKQYISDSIIETSISKDILLLTKIDKPALLRSLFELGCVFSGQILSYTKMMGQLTESGNTTTLSNYLNLLGQAGLLAGVMKYSENQIRQRASSPKLLVCNTALISSRHHDSFFNVKNQPDQWGRLVESAVGAHLLNHAQSGGYRIHYWRDRNDEIDFVLSRHGMVIGLVVSTSGSHKQSGMKAFHNRVHPIRIIMVGPSGIPWEEFLTMDPSSLFA